MKITTIALFLSLFATQAMAVYDCNCDIFRAQLSDDTVVSIKSCLGVDSSMGNVERMSTDVRARFKDRYHLKCEGEVTAQSQTACGAFIKNIVHLENKSMKCN